MKYLFITVLTLVWTFTAAQDFRQSKWFDSIEEVKKVEGPEGWKESGDHVSKYITKPVTVGGFGAMLAFYFTEGKLSAGTYIFTEQHTNPNLYIDDYLNIEGVLQGKYGTSSEVNNIWSNTLYKDDPEQYGLAISAGHYELGNTWRTENTGVVHSLKGDNFEIFHRIQYVSLALLDRHLELSKKKLSRDF